MVALIAAEIKLHYRAFCYWIIIFWDFFSDCFFTIFYKNLFAEVQDGLVSILASLYACSVLEYIEVLGYTYRR